MLKLNKHLLKLFMFVTSGMAANLGSQFILSILIINFLGSELYGQYSYIIGILSFYALFYTITGKIIARFVPVVEANEKAKILGSTLILGFLCLSFAYFASFLFFYCLPKWRFWEPHLYYHDYSLLPIICVLLLKHYIDVFFRTLSRYVSALQKIGYPLWVDNTSTVVCVIFVAILTYLDISKVTGIFYIVSLQAMLATLSIILYTYLIHQNGDCFKLLFQVPLQKWPSIIAEHFHKYIKSYSLPANIQSLAGLLDSHLPAILLGQQTLYTETTYYKVAKKLFQITQNLIPQLTAILFPKIILFAEQQQEAFYKKFKLFSIASCLFCAFFAILLALTHQLWYPLYGITPTSDMYLLVLILAAGQTLQGLIQVNVLAIHTTHSTSAVLKTSLLKALIANTLMFYFYPDLNAIRIATILSISLLPNLLLIIYYSHHRSFFQFHRQFASIIIVAAVEVFIGFMIFHTYA